MRRLCLLLGLSTAAMAMSACASLKTGIDHLRDHPEHCAMAVEAVRALAASGKIAKNTPPEKVDEIIHDTQAALALTGVCPAPS